MAETQRKFGEFFDKMMKWSLNDTNEAEYHMEEWSELVSPEKWQEVREMLLTADLVLSFADDMAVMFQRRIANIETNSLYYSVIKEGHDFLRQIQEEAKQLGIEVASLDRPLTPTESLVASGAARVVE